MKKILIPIVTFLVVAALIFGVFAVLNISVKTADNSKNDVLTTAEASITDANSLRSTVEAAGYEKPTIKDKFLKTEISDEATTVDISTQTSPLNITRAGMFILTGTNDDLQVKVNAPESAEVRIVLDNVNITSKKGAVIDSEVADHTIVISKSGTTNTLTDADYGWVDETTEDNTPNGVIYAVSDLVVIGDGALKLNANGKFGISSHDDINLSANLDITSKGSAIHGSDSVYVLGGTYSISSENDGMHANDNLVITAGKIDITKSVEGLEGTTISITGGTIDIIASDDGVNASDQQTDSTSTSDNTDGALGARPDMPVPGDGNTMPPDMNNRGMGGRTPPTDMPTDGASAPNEFGGGGRQGRGGAEMNGGTFPQGGGPGDGEEALDYVWLYVSGGTITVTINGRGDGIDSNGHILQTGGIIKSNDNATGGDGPYDYNGIYGFFPENGAEIWANDKQLSAPMNTSM